VWHSVVKIGLGTSKNLWPEKKITRVKYKSSLDAGDCNKNAHFMNRRKVAM